MDNHYFNWPNLFYTFSDIFTSFFLHQLSDTATGAIIPINLSKGPFKCYVKQWGVSALPEKALRRCVWLNVISVTWGWWVGSNFQEKNA